ncbi:hypothetical protein LCGC14_1220580 [marine sediment metagenome]|uniref:Uncharacterized protein n=1 Tax=marine sediment metagenome TaxID=412755 RepID=A0A0F9PFW2_9ZZZZ
MTIDLHITCSKILSFCLGLGQEKEKLLVLFDQSTRKLAENFARAGRELQGKISLHELPLGRKQENFPEKTIQVVEDFTEEDAIIILSSINLIYNLQLHNIISPFTRLESISARTLYLPPIPIESLNRIMSTNLPEYLEYEEAVLNAFSDVNKIELRTDGGTEVTFRCRTFGYTPYRALTPGSQALFHLGEVWTAPVEDSTEGTLVYDTCLAMGKIYSKLIFQVSRGRISNHEIIGKRDPVIKEFLKVIFQADEHALIPAELGIRTGDSYG